ncbi:MAG: tRNA uridine(34) 5-carboxymethylaminomethyl modification radical SAM/GNAT enzyme Elp3 [Candidatus Paceibacterota bacterium]|jgi:elongator complex protein 3
MSIQTEEIIKELAKRGSKTPDDLNKVKRFVSKKYKTPCPTNMSLLKSYHELVENKKLKNNPKLEIILRTRPIRSLSGIVNISVLTKTFKCPGKCIFCPAEKGLPKSYLSGEPAVERAKKLNFDPYLQVGKRIEMLKEEGHPTDKIELRIVGGTWSYYPKLYKNWFIKRCFEACNGKNSKSLKESQRINEKATHRVVGLSIETRPDFINEKEIKHLRELGVTMVELGVQSVYDDVLEKNHRGHTREQTITATRILKNHGFKVLYQIMPNLAGSDLKRDEYMFKELFSNPDFQPDYLKIYPCALIKGTELYNLWKNKKYKPYAEKDLISLVKETKQIVPSYVRIQRITRDIPAHSIVAGPAKLTNLRQILKNSMEKENWECKCIRCREIKGDYNPKEKLFLFKTAYSASRGKEMFLSFKDKKRKRLYSLLRLRLAEGKALIREVHTFGQMQSLNIEEEKSPQHKGLGKRLVKEAEKIAKRNNADTMSVISGIGAREYYRKLGYKLRGTYMIKSLS